MNDREESLAEIVKRRARDGGFATEAKPAAASNGNAGETEEEVEASAGCYGFLRGVRDRALHLEVRRRAKPWVAPGYAWLVTPVYDPDGKITLHYASGDQVVISGRNLLPMFQLILRHRVTWIEEQGKEWRAKREDSLTVIYEIDYKDTNADAAG